jgi:hypothetical protein
MNQKYFVHNLTRPLRLYPDQVGALREQSPPQSRIKNPESKITSPSNPLLFLLTLSLLSSFTACAWDDDDDSKPFHQSNYTHQNSATDYGYKNPYQSKIQNPRESVSRERGEESRITPTSSIDFGGPKRLAQADDDDDSKPFSQSRIKNSESKINYTSPHQAYDDNDSNPFSQSTHAVSLPRPASGPQPRGNIQNSANDYEATRTRALHVDSVQESVALRDRESKEMMAESQRSFERQEAQQEKSRAQMAKQQEIYDEMDQEECEMAEFLGGVYKAKFGATTGHSSAITSDGYVFRSGNNFVTPKGIYTKTGNTYAGPGSFTTQTGTLFFGNESTTIQAGGAYFSEGKSGFIVSPNCRNTSTWRSR